MNLKETFMKPWQRIYVWSVRCAYFVSFLPRLISTLFLEKPIDGFFAPLGVVELIRTTAEGKFYSSIVTFFILLILVIYLIAFTDFFLMLCDHRSTHKNWNDKFLVGFLSADLVVSFIILCLSGMDTKYFMPFSIVGDILFIPYFLIYLTAEKSK